MTTPKVGEVWLARRLATQTWRVGRVVESPELVLTNVVWARWVDVGDPVDANPEQDPTWIKRAQVICKVASP